MIQPSNWSQVQRGTKGKASVTWPARDSEFRERGPRCEARDGLLEHARHPLGLIGDPPPPLHRSAERRRALLLRALPLARARRQLDKEPARL